jgi:hypothetical protein
MQPVFLFNESLEQTGSLWLPQVLDCGSPCRFPAVNSKARQRAAAQYASTREGS